LCNCATYFNKLIRHRIGASSLKICDNCVTFRKQGLANFLMFELFCSYSSVYCRTVKDSKCINNSTLSLFKASAHFSSKSLEDRRYRADEHIGKVPPADSRTWWYMLAVVYNQTSPKTPTTKSSTAYNLRDDTRY
jgi:hypothetical protein